MLAFVRFCRFLFCLGALWPVSQWAYATACSESFPDGVSSTDSNGGIVLQYGAKIYNSPDNVISSYGFYDNSGGGSCGAVNCTSTATLAPVTRYSNFPSGADILLGYQQALTLLPGHYRQLVIGNEAVLTLKSGTYSFSFGVSMQYGAKILLESGATVALYTDKGFTMGGATVNEPKNGELLVYSTTTITLESNSTVNAYLFSVRNTTIGSNAVLTGGLSSDRVITLQSGATINYVSPASVNFADFCTSSAPPAPVLTSFVVDVTPGTGSTCLASDIVIEARDASNQLLPSYTGTVTLSTSKAHGDWAKTTIAADALGVLTAGAGDTGSATYQFAADGSDLGSIKLSLADTHAETLTIQVSGDGISKTSSNLTFSENAFRVLTTDSLGSDQIAGRDHAYRLQMMRRDPSTGLCGVATGYTAAQVKVWLTRAAADPSGAAPVLINSNSSQSLPLPNSQPGSNNFIANFVAGEANVRLASTDVGYYALQVRDDSLSFSDQSISGGSSNVTVRPFAFELAVDANPGAVDASGGVFKAAGSAFTASVRAVLWAQADDQNSDGIADGHNDSDPSNNASLANNTSAPSFGRETPAETLTLSAVLVAPAAGVDPGLSSSLAVPSDGRIITAFTNGSGSSGNIYFNEVGVIELSATLSDGVYLGSTVAVSQNTVSQSGPVGRFIPSYFQLGATSLSSFCGSGLDFSYLGQSFDVAASVEAKSTLASTTQNYAGDFVKLKSGLGTVEAGALDVSTGTDLTSRAAIVSGNYVWAAGIGALTWQVQVARATSPDGPYSQAQTGIKMIDADGVALAPAALNLDVDGDSVSSYALMGQTYLKYGRLVLADSYGPETADLPVAMEVEYWDGTDWLVNQDDSCSIILQTAIHYPDGSIDVPANRTVSLGSGSTTGFYGVENGTSVGFVGGDAEHYFSAPGVGNTGSFVVNVDVEAWLRFDWNQDGDYSDASLPEAEFTFGLYRGHDRVLYWQEVLQ